MELPALGGLVAAVSTVAAGPFVQSWLHRRQRFDHPNERSSHSVPTPRGGGLACAIGGAAGALATQVLGSGVTANWVGSSAVLSVVGRFDDVVGLPPAPRFGAQLLVGAATGARAGGPLGGVIGAATVPSIVNAFNFMDGINGISGATSLAWGTVIALDPAIAQSIRIQGAITAGMGIGFLPYNVPRASMFLGDVGSYLLGSGIAATVLESAFLDSDFDLRSAGRTVAPMAPYLADTGITVLRRAIRGDSVTEAHREHAYQRIVHEAGWPHWVVSGLVGSAAVACGLAARSRYGVATIASVVALYLASPSFVKWANPQTGESDPRASGGPQ